MPRAPVVTVLLLVVVLPSALLAHGGGFVAPRTVTVGVGPIANPADSSGGAPTTGAGSGSAASASGPTAAGANAKTGGLASGLSLDVASVGWQYWWEFNKDRYLDLKNRTDRLASEGGSDGHLTGRGRRLPRD